MNKLDKIIEQFEESCATLCITNDSPDKEMIKEYFEKYYNVKLRCNEQTGKRDI